MASASSALYAPKPCAPPMDSSVRIRTVGWWRCLAARANASSAPAWYIMVMSLRWSQQPYVDCLATLLAAAPSWPSAGVRRNCCAAAPGDALQKMRTQSPDLWSGESIPLPASLVVKPWPFRRPGRPACSLSCAADPCQQKPITAMTAGVYTRGAEQPNTLLCALSLHRMI